MIFLILGIGVQEERLKQSLIGVSASRPVQFLQAPLAFTLDPQSVTWTTLSVR